LGAVATRDAVVIIAGLLARLTAHPAPSGIRRLADIAAALLDDARHLLASLPDGATRRIVADAAAAVREVAGNAGDRLLHWDLHFENVLAPLPGSGRTDAWLAIDPKPLAGDPGFELLPALHNRYDPAETRWRFDAMTEVLGLDRAQARAWTLARVLQNCIWSIREGHRYLNRRQP
jgi:streptomycin 6-kinase